VPHRFNLILMLSIFSPKIIFLCHMLKLKVTYKVMLSSTSSTLFWMRTYGIRLPCLLLVDVVNVIWHTYYSQGQIPHATADRGSFWWRDLLHLCDKFRGVATCTVGNGTSVLF
jgi:hypothetical protein